MLLMTRRNKKEMEMMAPMHEEWLWYVFVFSLNYA
jgi:hypothetical protein